MAKVVFRLNDGDEKTFDAKPGWSVMQTAMRNGVAGIEADCGGSAACATCHVFIDAPWLEWIDPPEPFEVEMLDMIPSRRINSRLSCQITIRSDFDGITVEIPDEQTNISL